MSNVIHVHNEAGVGQNRLEIPANDSGMLVDTDTAQTVANKTFTTVTLTGPTITDPSITESVQVLAAAGASQGDAGVITVTYGFVHATAADGTKGVKLPAAAAGRKVSIKNSDAANAILKVYPATGDAVNALSANSSISMAAKTSAEFWAVDATTWFTISLLPS